MFRKTKLSSAVVIALATTVSATMLTGLTGCKLTEGGTSITGGQASTITNPKGTVIGNVQDTNGLPLAGVEVYLAGKKTKTDMGGNYRFANVPVTGVVGAGAAPAANNVLSVTILPEAGYLGATVTVNPQAQISNNGDTGGGSVNPVTTFIDGFMAQAGTAVLPALNATSSGILRNNLTGEPLANQAMSLDMVNTNTVAQQQVQNGVATSYATYNYTATTDADGNFTFTGLPNDSQLRVVVPMYGVNTIGANSVGGNITTNNETSDLWHGNVFATLVTALDGVTPYVTAVVEVTNALSDPGTLHDDVTNTLTVNFSETMNSAMVDANSVRVIDYTTNTWLTATATMAADGKSMTIVSTTDFVEGNEIHVHMLLADFQDMAGNTITADQLATNAPTVPNRISYDYLGGTTAGGNDTTTSSYLELQVMQYAEANADAQSVTSFMQLATDDTGSDDMYEAASNAFNDTRDGTAGIQQVNDQTDADGVAGTESARRLQQLLVEQGGTAPVQTNVARLSFASSNAASYIIDITSGGTAVGAAAVAARVNDASSEIAFPGGTLAANQFTVTGATGAVALSLTNATIGDIVTITPYDDFGYAGTGESITIADNVKPRTVLQNSYGETLGTDHDGVVVPTFGDGGELSQVGSSNVGVPYLAISAGLLDNLDDNGDAVDGAAGGADDTLQEELYAHNAADTTTSTAASPCDTVPADCTIDKADGVYDATAWAVFSGNLARTVGVSMSENVAVAGTPATTGIAGAALSGWTANNNVTVQDDGGAPGVGVAYSWVDLVQFDATDVIALANADAGGVIDFAGTITDNAGNTADADTAAKVVIRDAMPPMVTNATYTGTQLTITFNEDIQPKNTDDILIGSPAVTLNVTDAVVAAHTAALAADKNKLVFDMTDTGVTAGADVGVYADIDLGNAIDYATPYAASTGAAVSWHFSTNFNDIDDASADNNSWGAESAGVTPPMFAGLTAVDPVFAVPNLTNPTASATATQTFVFTANHPIDTVTNFGAAQADAAILTLTEAQMITAGFDYTDAGSVSMIGGTCELTGSLNSARTSLTVTLDLTDAACVPATPTAGEILVVGTITSDYDVGQPANPADVTQQ